MNEVPLMQSFMYEASRAMPSVRLFRRNVGVIMIEDRVFKAGIKGQCDIYAYTKGGRVVEIETKAKRGVLSENQKHWRDWCVSWGVPWMQLKPLKSETSEQTVTRWVEELRQCVS
jgi:hypothetical protein